MGAGKDHRGGGSRWDVVVKQAGRTGIIICGTAQLRSRDKQAPQVVPHLAPRPPSLLATGGVCQGPHPSIPSAVGCHRWRANPVPDPEAKRVAGVLTATLRPPRAGRACRAQGSPRTPSPGCGKQRLTQPRQVAGQRKPCGASGSGRACAQTALQAPPRGCGQPKAAAWVGGVRPRVLRISSGYYYGSKLRGARTTVPAHSTT